MKKMLAAAVAFMGLAACNPYGMEYTVGCNSRGVVVVAHNPTEEAWDVWTDIDNYAHLVVPGETYTIQYKARPATVKVTTGGPSGKPDHVEQYKTGC